MTVRFDTLDTHEELVLDRADRRNALTPEMLVAMRERIEAHAHAQRMLLIRGEGRCFCAGFDLTLCRSDGDPAAGDEVLDALLVGLDAAVRAMRNHGMPIVLAAHGAAIAGGCALLAAADVVVTDAQAKLGYPVTVLGISPAVSIPTLRLAADDGFARLRTLDPGITRGRDAHAASLAHACVEAPDDVLDRARTIARELADKPALALATTKRWLNTVDGSAELPTTGITTSRDLVGSDEQRALLPRAWSR